MGQQMIIGFFALPRLFSKSKLNARNVCTEAPFVMYNQLHVFTALERILLGLCGSAY